MATDSDKRLERRVIEAAEQALAARGFVAAIDVLAGLGWLPPSSEQGWRQGRIPFLERAVNANLSKISRAMRHFRRWAKGRGLKPSETAYVARTRDRRPLRFSKSGKPSIELAYRTHWVSPKLSERKRYERQGILVEEKALAEAERRCLADEEAHAGDPVSTDVDEALERWRRG